MQKTGVRRKKQQSSDIRHVIIESISDKKGEDTVCLDLRKIKEAVADYFIICHATSTTQVKALADYIEEKVRKDTGENPSHSEGFRNLEWVVLDFFNIVVHIFLKDRREFYQLEELWSDAPVTEYE